MNVGPGGALSWPECGSALAQEPDAALPKNLWSRSTLGQAGWRGRGEVVLKAVQRLSTALFQYVLRRILPLQPERIARADAWGHPLRKTSCV